MSSTHTAEHPDAKHAGGRTGRQPRRRSCPDAIEPPRQGSNAPLRGVQRNRPSSFRESAAEGASLFRQSKIVCGVKYLFRRQLFCSVIRPVCPYCVSRTYDGHGVDDPPWSERHRRCFGCASQFPPRLQLLPRNTFSLLPCGVSAYGQPPVFLVSESERCFNSITVC